MNRDSIVDIAKTIQESITEYQWLSPQCTSQQKAEEYALKRMLRLGCGKFNPTMIESMIKTERSVYRADTIMQFRSLKMSDMNQCSLGDELLLRDEEKVFYVGKVTTSYKGFKDAHEVKDQFGVYFEVSNEGKYEVEGDSDYDVVSFAKY